MGRKWGTGAPAEAARVLGGTGQDLDSVLSGNATGFRDSPIPSGNRTGIVRVAYTVSCLKIEKAKTHSREGTRCGCQRPHHHCYFLPAWQRGLPFLQGYSHDLAASPDQLWRGNCWGLNRVLQLISLQQPKSESFPGAAWPSFLVITV